MYADMPYAWVNLRHGIGAEELAIMETNTAAVGSLTLEMGLLSRLTGMSLCIVTHPVKAACICICVVKQHVQNIW